MRRFLLRRAAHTGVVVLTVVTLVFVLFRFAPGDPFLANSELSSSVQEHAQFRARWGYDLPIGRQYLQWLGNFGSGDFGWSHSASRPVRQVIGGALANTALLMLPALILGWLAAVAVGTWSAVRRGTVLARAWDALSLACVSVPEFLAALGVVSVIAVTWRLAPAGGMVDVALHDAMSPLGRAVDIGAHLVLPCATLAAMVTFTVSRYHRAAVLGVLREEYLRTARAKGVSERQVIWRHILPNSVGPAIALAGLLLPTVFGGAVFIEKIFAWPGMGRALVDAVLGRDYELVQAIVVISTVLVSAGGAIADVVAARVNPRMRLDS